jgi:hypothetical protein
MDPIFTNMAYIPNCPTPISMEDQTAVEEQPQNPILENQVEIKYWFPNHGDPNMSNLIFHSQADLVDALLKCKEPTLLFTSKNYNPD